MICNWFQYAKYVKEYVKQYSWYVTSYVKYEQNGYSICRICKIICKIKCKICKQYVDSDHMAEYWRQYAKYPLNIQNNMQKIQYMQTRFQSAEYALPTLLMTVWVTVTVTASLCQAPSRTATRPLHWPQAESRCQCCGGSRGPAPAAA
jgi:hypothetical protein